MEEERKDKKKKKKKEERGLERSVGLNIYSRAVDANRNKHNEKKKKKRWAVRRAKWNVDWGKVHGLTNAAANVAYRCVH